jgi:F-type H+-transporting ATPase subunit b
MLHLMQEPETWVAVAFVIFLGVLLYVGVHNKVIAALDQRGARIKSELDEARRLRDEAQALLTEYQRKQGEAEREAEAIIAEAKAEAERVAAEARGKMEEFVARKCGRRRPTPRWPLPRKSCGTPPRARLPTISSLAALLT